MRKFIVAGLIGLAVTGHADTVQQIGTYSGWSAVNWNPIVALNDGVDGGAQLDFVGDAGNPGAYWGVNDGYVFFRMRLNVATVDSSTFSDSHFVLFDVAGYGLDSGAPDFGFVWDSKSAKPLSHGLEMSILSVSGTDWKDIKMDDIDLDAAKKGTNDINGDGRDTDGYVQTSDGQVTDTFGETTYLDYAVSLSYLETHVSDFLSGDVKVQFASIANSTDHNALSADIAGGASPDSLVTSGWSEAIAIPEPATLTFVLCFGGGLLLFKRRFAA
ncbi:hypothetical protein P4B35_13905 [Pontiellaceae bacterium B12227]|nr:hypothetical protein [Pontiellaceae bacterium B12227]